MEGSQNLLSERQQLQNDFVDNVTLHGYRYLFTSRSRIRRCIWWICFLAAFVFAAYLFYGAVQDFYLYKSYTVTEFDYAADGLELPTLTFCFANPFTKLNRAKFPLKADERFFDTMNKDLFDRKKLSAEGKRYLRKLKAKKIETYKQLFELFLVNPESSIKDPVVNKMFSRGGCKFTYKTCQKQDFRFIIDRYGRSCLNYNYYSKKTNPKKQRSFGRKGWFEMYFNLHQDKALSPEKEGRQVRLFIHDRKRPHLDAYDVEIMLEPGKLTTVSVEESKLTTLLPPPYGQCSEKKFEVFEGIPYSAPACRLDCILKGVIEKCGCIGFDYKEFVKNISICSIQQMVTCYTSSTFDAAKKKRRACAKRCPEECVQMKYPLRTERVDLVTEKRVTRIKRHIPWLNNRTQIRTYIKENIVGVKFGFASIVIRKETATPSVTFTSLIGTIGGSIGLGLGFSVLTLVEFILFFFDYFRLWFPCSSKRKSKENRKLKTDEMEL